MSQRNARRNEDEEARQRRLLLDAESHRESRENEDDEARQRRLSLMAERNRISREPGQQARANET
mgnify:CR=1 FL=1